MTFEEFRAVKEKVSLRDLSEEAQRQWDGNGTDDYRDRIRCCHNCSRWCVDHTLMGEYAYNACMAEGMGTPEGGITNTKFDFWCPMYDGVMEEPNLAFEEMWGMVG